MKTYSQELANIPAELREQTAWMQYYLKPDPKRPEKKPDKHPCVKYSQRGNLRTLDYLIDKRRAQDGVQIVIFKEAGFTYIDLDHCRNPKTGELTPWAQTIVDLLDSYTEVSAGKDGLHIVVKATLSVDFKVEGNAVEIYSANIPNKPIAMTGEIVDLYCTIEARQAEVEQLLQQAVAGKFGPVDNSKPAPPSSAKTESLPVIEEPEIKDDEEPLPKFPRLPGALARIIREGSS